MNKPIVYIASPYTKGDPAISVHFQCNVFNKLMDDRKVWPIVPLSTHFQHTLFPRPYEDWVGYDKAMLCLYDACLRLKTEIPELGYSESESSGTDGEVDYFKSVDKPVFYTIESLYEWIDSEKSSVSNK